MAKVCFENSATPSPPAAGKTCIFVDITDGHTKQIDEFGNVIDLTDVLDSVLYQCDASVVVGDLVYVSGNDTVNRAIANDNNKKFAIGVSVSKPTTTTTNVRSSGKQGGFSGLTAGLPVFLSDSTLGGITQTPITTGGNWLQLIGMATSATEIHLELGPPIKRI